MYISLAMMEQIVSPLWSHMVTTHTRARTHARTHTHTELNSKVKSNGSVEKESINLLNNSAVEINTVCN